MKSICGKEMKESEVSCLQIKGQHHLFSRNHLKLFSTVLCTAPRRNTYSLIRFRKRLFRPCHFPWSVSKASDTLDHSSLISELNRYGAKRASFLQRFKNDLINRNQFVVANNHNSDRDNVVCRVPHWSILGPQLLYLLFILTTFIVQWYDCNDFLCWRHPTCSVLRAIWQVVCSTVSKGVGMFSRLCWNISSL